MTAITKVIKRIEEEIKYTNDHINDFTGEKRFGEDSYILGLKFAKRRLEEEADNECNN